jgi:D-alanyl-D-alanine-carboxypeptidase/D-alanyl-D-alanine-endopeptidase
MCVVSSTHMKTPLPTLLLSLSLPALAQSPSPQPAAPSPLDGLWLGTLHTGGPNLRLQFHLHADAAGKWTCTLDSLDQQAMDIPCAVTSAVNPIVLDIAVVHGKFTATLTADTLDGTFTQGADLPLTLTRQAKPIAAPPPNPPDAALPPATIDTIRKILDQDIGIALDKGALAPSTHTGVTIGIVQHGVRRIFSYGTAQPDSVFEIGSISKTFTALILAQMVEQQKVRLDEPVRDLLPPNTVPKPAGPPFVTREITLLDLSDQHSGLPRMPDNFAPADPTNPYADYDAAHLYAYIAKHGLAIEPNPPFGYSNLGVGLLGQALSVRAAEPYPQLLHEQVTGPLGMTETAIALTPSMKSRFIQGHDAEHNPAHAWDLDALAGAGGIRSTAADMLTYLEAQLHPDHLPATATSTPNGKTLPAAIALDHILHADAGEGMHIALNWFQYDATGSFWHNGGTGGYSSYAIFNPAQDFAVIVLSNVSPGPDTITDHLGLHIAQRLQGKPAISLAPQPH